MESYLSLDNSERTGQQLKTVKHFQSAAELKELILAAQKGDKLAIETLCKAFEPLILKEAHRSNIIQNLGEDAVNTAWEIFLEFIHSFNRHSYLRVPGLLKQHLHYALILKLERQKSVTAATSLDQTDNMGKKIMDPSDDNYFMQQFLLRLQIDSALDKLTQKQKDVIEATYLKGYSLKEYASKNKISFTAAYTLQNRAIQALKNILA